MGGLKSCKKGAKLFLNHNTPFKSTLMKFLRLQRTKIINLAEVLYLYQKTFRFHDWSKCLLVWKSATASDHGITRHSYWTQRKKKRQKKMRKKTKFPYYCTLHTSKELFQGCCCENIGGRSFKLDRRDVKLIFDESLENDKEDNQFQTTIVKRYSKKNKWKNDKI